HLALRRQVGNYIRRKGAAEISGRVHGSFCVDEHGRARKFVYLPGSLPAIARGAGDVRHAIQPRRKTRNANLRKAGAVKTAATPKIIVIGGGLAGLSAVIKIAEMGATVDLFSIVPVKRSHSVCAQGGINAAKNLKGEGDSTWKHFDDTVYGGDFLANQPPVKDMCEAAPGIIDLLDRMGVMFNRTPEGLLDFRRFGGTLFHRTAFAGATTGQQLLYALDEQVRRFESEDKVKKFEGWTFLSAVLDDGGVCRGICAMDLKTMEIKTFPCDAAIFCTGGIGAVFGRSTNSVVCTG